MESHTFEQSFIKNLIRNDGIKNEDVDAILKTLEGNSEVKIIKTAFGDVEIAGAFTVAGPEGPVSNWN